jgi:hypothetical protein
MSESLLELLNAFNPDGTHDLNYATDLIYQAHAALVQEQGRANSSVDVIRAAQQILAKYLVPDSGIIELTAINELLGLLDCKNILALTGAGGRAS